MGVLLAAAAAVLFAVLAVFSGGWGAFWFGLLAVGAVAEAVALWRKGKGDTLSEQVWRVTRGRWSKVGLAVFLGWVLLHFTTDGAV